MNTKLSIILPALNEGIGLANLLPKLRLRFQEAEILVIDDGSSDETRAVCQELGVQVISHAYSVGNGAAIKTGARHATGDVLVFMDADGQHAPEDVSTLLEKLDEGYDMVVGARENGTQSSSGRRWANAIYNCFAGFMVSQRVADLTSGFRAVDARKFREYLYLLPNGFSYPTTITMCFFRAGYSVCYVPIRARKRQGKSHIRLMRDGIRFFLIIFRVGTLYSPLKVFAPISLGLFGTGLGYYVYTFLTIHRFTNMSALLLVSSILVFVVGLVSEQVTMLLYQKADSGLLITEFERRQLQRLRKEVTNKAKEAHAPVAETNSTPRRISSKDRA
jgi:glycosyltransferase involved in cell wall biosynthesis